MSTETPQLVISRVFDAPRELVFRVFDAAGPDLRVHFHVDVPEHLAHLSVAGWRQAFAELGAVLMDAQAVAADHRR
jgi:uncharacterized protein YndB with AHSA1/START domain